MSSSLGGLSIVLAGVLGSAPMPEGSMILGPERGYAEGGEDRLLALTADALGRRIEVGWSKGRYGDVRGLVLRYTPDGALDPSFGKGGVVRLPAERGFTHLRLRGVAVAGARIIVVGDEGDGKTSLGFASALDEHGDVLRDFAERFRSTIDLRPLIGAAWLRSRPVEIFRSILVDREGRLIVAGTSSDVRFSWRGLRRVYRGFALCLEPSGAVDRSFAVGGVYFVGGLHPSSERGRDEVLRVRAMPRGLGLVGWSEGPAANEERGFVVQLDPDGYPIPGILQQGVWSGPARSAAEGKKEVFYDLELTHDHTFVSGFSFSDDERRIAALVRELAPSEPEGFAVRRSFLLPRDVVDSEMALATAMRVDEDGHLVLAGYTQDHGDHFRAGDRGFVVVTTSTGAVLQSYLSGAKDAPGIELHDLLVTRDAIIAVGSARERALSVRLPRSPPTGSRP